MAQRGSSLLIVCSSCRSLLTKKALRETRTFTSTSQRSRSIPSFTPTSSPELDELFLSFREKIFTPFALAQHHRDLIYKKSRHPVLQNDPGVIVTLSNDEEIRLMPMEPREKPSKKKSLNTIARLLGESSEPEKWNNLPAFLEGMEMAREGLPPHWMGKIARKANLTGKTGVIKLCAEMVKKTGVTLAHPEMTRELMLGYHFQALQGNFTGEALEKAVKNAEQVSLMMEDKLHCAGKLKSYQKDMRKDSAVLGVLLELAAFRAVNVYEGKDTGGKVAGLVSRMLASTKDESWTVPTGASNQQTESVLEHADVPRMEQWIPLWNGIKTALKIDSILQHSDVSSLRSMKDNIEMAVCSFERDVRAGSKGKPTRFLSMLDAVEARAS